MFLAILAYCSLLVCLYSATVPNRPSPPAILLRESFRGGAQGSRLAAVRWADQHAVAEPWGLSRFEEDDLSPALAALAPRQDHIEEAFYRVALHTMGRAPTVVVYDGTASYLD